MWDPPVVELVAGVVSGNDLDAGETAFRLLVLIAGQSDLRPWASLVDALDRERRAVDLVVDSNANRIWCEVYVPDSGLGDRDHARQVRLRRRLEEGELRAAHAFGEVARRLHVREHQRLADEAFKREGCAAGCGRGRRLDRRRRFVDVRDGRRGLLRGGRRGLRVDRKGNK